MPGQNILINQLPGLHLHYNQSKGNYYYYFYSKNLERYWTHKHNFINALCINILPSINKINFNNEYEFIIIWIFEE